MAVFIYFAFFLLISLGNSLIFWDLKLIKEKGTPHARLVGTEIPKLTQFSVCFWVNPESNLYNAVSYANKNTSDGIVFAANDTNTLFIVNGEDVTINAAPAQDKWSHVCVSWKSENGQVDVYYDGKKYSEPVMVSVGKSIDGDGVLILGQDQDKLGGGFEKHQGLGGKITEVHFWDQVISKKTVDRMFSCSASEGGNIVNWKTATWSLGNYAIPITTDLPCLNHLLPFSDTCQKAESTKN